MYKNDLIDNGAVFQMALTRDKAFIYGSNDVLIYNLNLEENRWDSTGMNGQQIEIDSDSKIWLRDGNVIKDPYGDDFSDADCQDFVVDDTYIFLLRTLDKVLLRKRKDSSQRMY